MCVLGGAWRRPRRVVARAVVASAVISGGVLAASLPQRAEATLPGSAFNALDASPTSDLAAGAVAISDPVGNLDTSNYGGSTENDVCPTIQKGTASPKDDLDTFYFGSKTTGAGAFMYVGWHRVSTTGTTTIDFELNHASGVKRNCNGFNPPRTAGDLLITYDFKGSSPFTLDIHQRKWIGTSNAGVWGPSSPLPAASFEASINSDGSFGELVVNLTAANILGTTGCESFTTVFPKTRSSSTSFTATIKDFVPPLTATVSNCGSVSVHKQDDAAAALSGVVFDLYSDVANAPVVAVVPAQSCTTNASGDCTIIDVYPGTYWVVERAPPTGYTGAAAQKVAVALAGNTPAGTLTFVNTRKPIGISLVKKVDGARHPQSDPLYTESGDEVTYTLTITNTGQLPLTITALTDSLHAGVLDDCEQGIGSTLAPSESFDCTYTAAPTEDTENTASVTGTDVLGRTTSSSDTAFVVPLHPAIRVEKSGPSGAHVGDTVTYTLVVTNPGDAGLDDVTVVDDTCAAAPELVSQKHGDNDATLEPGETWTYTCEYTVRHADGASVTNQVEVSGTDMLDTTVTWDDEFVFPVLRPAIAIDKTASPTSVAVSGTVTFTYVVTNTGDTTLFDIVVDDDVLGRIGTVDELAPGKSTTLSTSVTVAAGSPTVNVGTAEGVDRLGLKVRASDSATITVVLGETFVRTVDLPRVPELPRTGAAVSVSVHLALALWAAGATLVLAARRRRPQSTRA